MKLSNIFKPQDLTRGPIIKQLITFALPILFSNAFQMLYNTADTVIIGHVLGSTALAAAGSAAAVYDLLLGFTVGLSDGLSLSVAHSIGAGDMQRAKRSVASALKMGLIVMIIITICASLFMKPFLKLLNTPDNILDMAYSYIIIIAAFLIIQFLYNIFAGILRATGNSIIPVLFLIASSIINIILDLLFIMVCGMGIAGAAVATVIAQAVSVVIFAVYIKLKVPELIPGLGDFVFNKKDLEMTLQGLSMAFMSSIVFIGTAILQTGINGLGTLIIAGHTAARKIFHFISLPSSALTTAIYNFTAQNYGAGQPDRIRKALRDTYIMDVIITIFSVALSFFASYLVIWISGSDESELVTNAARYIRIGAPFYLVLGILTSTRCAIQAINQKLLPFLSSVIECVGKILFVYLLVPVYGYNAVIFCEPVIWCFMTAELLPTFWLNPFIRRNKKA